MLYEHLKQLQSPTSQALRVVSASDESKPHFHRVKTAPPNQLVATRAISDILSSFSLHGRSSGTTGRRLGRPHSGGDPEAFDELVIRYSPRLYGLILPTTSNHEDTNDLLQEVFAKAYRSISGFRGKSSFYTWIHSIAVNMTINFVKSAVDAMR